MKKVIYLCAMAHTTVIEHKDFVKGIRPEAIQCNHINCNRNAVEAMIFDSPSLHATHEFYNQGLGDILTLEQQKYVDAGGLLFREIKGQQPKEIVNEYKNTQEQIRLGDFLLKNFDVDKSKTIVDTAIDLLKSLKGYMALGKMIKSDKNVN